MGRRPNENGRGTVLTHSVRGPGGVTTFRLGTWRRRSGGGDGSRVVGEGTGWGGRGLEGGAGDGVELLHQPLQAGHLLREVVLLVDLQGEKRGLLNRLRVLTITKPQTI